MELVGFHGVDTNAVINNKGVQIVFDTGQTLSATVNFGGVQAVESAAQPRTLRSKGSAS